MDKIVVICRATCGGKAAGRDFRNHLRSCIEHLGFTVCLDYPDFLTRPEIKSSGQACYEYVILHMDDASIVSDKAKVIIRNRIGRCFVAKKGSIGPSTRHLCRSVRKVLLDNMAEAWDFSSSHYVRAAADNVESYLKNK